jgi:hypothetical protein
MPVNTARKNYAAALLDEFYYSWAGRIWKNHSGFIALTNSLFLIQLSGRRQVKLS